MIFVFFKIAFSQIFLTGNPYLNPITKILTEQLDFDLIFDIGPGRPA